ncbi:TPR-like protein [Basidiobolus meristosporus CBS 931.73]|uniref:TPR-like protein n=1 Tax=Basidiobolus meristosporus CBS 931.73 TaxID=1314790 RepID=A0A1Y1YCI1_9FUNG|nr:TPR-like protein [Basidiobolus meristosporus CBS 931.73]|eukprot:ORX95682.1 TPR-like protein [Basidiobolus meristosporus CBS 931.73]
MFRLVQNLRATRLGSLKAPNRPLDLRCLYSTEKPTLQRQASLVDRLTWSLNKNDKAEAWALYKAVVEAGEEGNLPSKIWPRLLRTFNRSAGGAEPDVSKCQEILGSIARVEAEFHTLQEFTPVLSVLGLCEPYEQVRLVLEDMLAKKLKPDTFVCNLIINTLRKQGPREAYKMLEFMRAHKIPRDIKTYNILLKVCKMHNDPDSLNRAYDEMLAEGFKPDLKIYNSMIDANAKMKRIGKVEELSKEMIQENVFPDVFTYSTLIHAYSKSGNLRKATQLYRTMLERGVAPNVITYTTLLQAFVKRKRLNMAEEIFFQMLSNGIQPNHFTWTTFISALVDDLNLEKAMSCYKEMVQSNMVPTKSLFTKLINAHAEAFDPQGARRVYEEMLTHKVQPDIPAVGALIKAYKLAGAIPEAEDLFASIPKLGLQYNLEIYNLMIDGYIKNGQVQKGLDMYSEMRKHGIEPDLPMYTILMDSYSRLGKHDKVRELWMTIVEGGADLSLVSPHISVLLDSIRYNSDLEDLRTTWEEIRCTYPIDDNVYGSYLHALCSFGLFSEATKVLTEEMKDRPTTKTIGTLQTQLKLAKMNDLVREVDQWLALEHTDIKRKIDQQRRPN